MPLHRLALVLKKKKVSKYRFAKLLEIKYGNIFRFFKDDYDPTLSMMRKWSRVLRCKIRDFYSED